MKETRSFIEQLKGEHAAEAQQNSKGVLQAALEGVKEGLSAASEGMGQAWDGFRTNFGHEFDQGRTELAAALLSGNDRGFVMYPRTQQGVEQGHDHAAGHGLHGQEADRQQESGGREM